MTFEENQAMFERLSQTIADRNAASADILPWMIGCVIIVALATIVFGFLKVRSEDKKYERQVRMEAIKAAAAMQQNVTRQEDALTSIILRELISKNKDNLSVDKLSGLVNEIHQESAAKQSAAEKFLQDVLEGDEEKLEKLLFPAKDEE